jgi:hypothetical protein
MTVRRITSVSFCLRRLATRTARLVLGIVLTSSPAHAVCGDFTGDGTVSATDALGVLQVAIGSAICELHDCDVDSSGLVTATDALAVLKTAVGQGAILSCPPDPNCQADLDFFFERIWTPILTDCVNCHSSAGLASFTDHVLQPSSEPGYLEYDFGVLENLWMIGKGNLLLSKPLGVGHGGGQRLGMTEQSPEYADLDELLLRFENPVPDCGGAPADFLAGVTYLDDTAILRKAALLFAGRLPTAAENAAVATGGEAALRTSVRAFMTGENFTRFLMESANDRLLTDMFLNWGPSAFDVLGGDWFYPTINDRINAVGASQGPDAAWQTTVRTNRAFTQEPLRLIANVVNNDRPYTEILTADYIMVNPYSAIGYQAGVSFTDDEDEEEWREGANNGYTGGNYGQAGILNSPMFLGRYPSTATNRNRARARWTYYYFLGVDIEALAARPIDADALADDGNPTLTNPHCAVCHQVHDPVAGTFQNYGDLGQYREFETDSLPWTYKESDLYQWGDLWYRDMRVPAFNNVVMPGSRDDDAIRWLAEQIVNDPRFATGTVKFWFPAVFGQVPIEAPAEPSDANYGTRLAAWAAQDEVIQQLAAGFRDGGHDLKDLLVEMVLTPYFRASAVTGLNAARTDALAEIGLARLLTPEQLHRKIVDVTGVPWARAWSPDRPELLDEYQLLYGGIDSAGITVRPTELNALMSAVVQRMANESACPATVRDFSVPASQRRLFPHVEPTDLPGTGAGETAIRANIVHLRRVLLGEELATNDPEVDRTFAVFSDVHALRTQSGKSTYLPWGPAYCALDFDSGNFVTQDPNHTIRSWVAVMIYLLSDYRFIHE